MVDCCFQSFRNRPVQEGSGTTGWEMLRWLLAVGIVAGLVLGYVGLIDSSNGSVRIIEGRSRLSVPGSERVSVPGSELIAAARGRFEASSE